MRAEVKQSDREAAASSVLRKLEQSHGGYQAWMFTAVQPIRDGEQDDHWDIQAFAAHRHRAEEAIIRAADKWLAMQYGLRPLSADLAAIRSIDTRGE